MSGGTVASQYLAGSASPSGHSISSHSSSRGSALHSSRWAARTRTRAKREVSAPALPSRQEWTSPLELEGLLTNPGTPGGKDGGEANPTELHEGVQGAGGEAAAGR